MTDKYGPNTAQVEAYLTILPTLTREQWDTVRDTARDTMWDVVPWGTVPWDAPWDAVPWDAVPWDAAWDAAWDAGWHAGWHAERHTERAVARVTASVTARAAAALVVHDLIGPEQFDLLTAAMRAGGIDFDALGAVS